MATYTGTSSSDTISGGSGADYIDGGAGNDSLSGGAGSDTLDGGAGSDTLDGGSGTDVLNGGSGSDWLNAGSGDDLLVYKLSDAMSGDKDIYTGGSGKDTIQIEMTFAEFVSYKAQLDAYQAHLAVVTNAKTGEVSNSVNSDFTFTFGDSTLKVQMMEKLIVMVDGNQVNLGGNDIPVTFNASASVLEDGSVGGQVIANDYDLDALTYALVGSTPAGLTFNADGSYSFDASSYDALVAGEELVLNVAFTASDATSISAPANLTITVTGTNDVPVATAAVNAVAEDASIIGNVSGTDADAGETATLSYALVDPGSAPTGLTFNADGSYSFDASSYDALVAGEELVLNVAFTASDATSTSVPANLTITVTGTNDVPVATAAVNAVAEDASIIGNVSGTDADAGETATLSYALVDPGSAPAGLTFNGDGSYSFDASSYDALVAGEELVLNVAFTASDATSTSVPANLTITVTGTNDTASISGTTAGSVSEDGTLIASGNLSVSDADAGQSEFQPLAGSSSYGTYSITATGAWVYTLDNTHAAVQALNTGATLTDTFVVTSEDGTDSETVTITINGLNEPAPVFDQNKDAEATASSAVIINDGTTASILVGSAFNDSISGNNGADTIYGGAGDDSISGGQAADVIYGGSGNDSISGGDQIDRIFGGSGNDTITGNDQADLIYGGQGADRLTGAGQADTFVYLAADEDGDLITDFTVGVDTLSFNNITGYTGAGSVSTSAAGTNTLVTVELGADDLTLTLQGIYTTTQVQGALVDTAMPA